VLPIYLPPLRSRKDDISILFEYFLNELNKKLYSKIKSIDKKVFEKLEKHYWKGNVRELKNVVERAFILAENNEISLKHIIFSSNFSKENITYDENKSLKQIIREVESKIIKKALQEHESIRQAAKFLGISHVALLNKMKKLDIFC
jgi:transcriptional regulator of aroF, aroG, tyrA and aromatic amino acid transport